MLSNLRPADTPIQSNPQAFNLRTPAVQSTPQAFNVWPPAVNTEDTFKNCQATTSKTKDVDRVVPTTYMINLRHLPAQFSISSHVCL